MCLWGCVCACVHICKEAGGVCVHVGVDGSGCGCGVCVNGVVGVCERGGGTCAPMGMCGGVWGV